IFFFQAEDGIRDYKVTGVQTCALPICSSNSSGSQATSSQQSSQPDNSQQSAQPSTSSSNPSDQSNSSATSSNDQTSTRNNASTSGTSKGAKTGRNKGNLPATASPLPAISLLGIAFLGTGLWLSRSLKSHRV